MNATQKQYDMRPDYVTTMAAVTADERAVLEAAAGDAGTAHRARKHAAKVKVARSPSVRVEVQTDRGPVWVDVVARNDGGTSYSVLIGGGPVDYCLGGQITSLRAAVERGIEMLRQQASQ